MTVTVLSDTTNEPDETVRLIMSNPVNARLQNQEAIGTITDDDNPPISLFAMDDSGTISRVDAATGVTTSIVGTALFNSVDVESDANNNMVALDLGFFGNPQLVTLNAPTGQVLSTVAVSGLPGVIREGFEDVVHLGRGLGAERAFEIGEFHQDDPGVYRSPGGRAACTPLEYVIS